MAMNLSPNSYSHSEVNFPQEELTATDPFQDLSIAEVNPGFSGPTPLQGYLAIQSTPAEASAAMGLDQGSANISEPENISSAPIPLQVSSNILSTPPEVISAATGLDQSPANISEPENISSAPIPLQVSSAILSTPPEVISAATGPDQGPSNTANRENIAPTLIELQDLLKRRKVSSDFHASSLIFGLNFFNCGEHMISNVLKSYGFLYPMKAILNRKSLYSFNMYSTLPHPVDGHALHQTILPSGLESAITIDYVNNEPVVLTHTCETLRARFPLVEHVIYNLEGRQMTVEFTNGAIQFRVVGFLERFEWQTDNAQRVNISSAA